MPGFFAEFTLSAANGLRMTGNGVILNEHYERTWISPGEHSIRTVLRPEKGMLSQGHTVYLDSDSQQFRAGLRYCAPQVRYEQPDYAEPFVFKLWERRRCNLSSRNKRP
jgi:hypothetical protein